METRAMKGKLLGHEGLDRHIHVVWVPEKQRVFRCRDVRFKEDHDDQKMKQNFEYEVTIDHTEETDVEEEIVMTTGSVSGEAGQ